MKSTKTASNTPEYAQLLGGFDKAQSAYKQAKAAEIAAKHELKDADKKDLSKAEEEILRFRLKHAKHIRKACKAVVGIAKVAIKQWNKVNATETEEVVEAPKTKKRGRQPKFKAEKAAKAEKVAKAPKAEKVAKAPKAAKVKKATVEVTTEAAAPKKRGRQPQIKAEVEPVVINVSKEAPAPKKRGRQPKIVDVAEEVAVVAATEAPAPKKRGRQSKAVVTEEEAEGVAGASARLMAEMPEEKAPKAVRAPKAAKVVVKVAQTEKLAKAPKVEKVVKVAKPKVEKVAKVVKPKVEKAPKAPAEDKRPRRSPQDVAAEKAAAEAATKAAFQGDDFRIVEGIGPKVTSILHENGITTFKQLAGKSYDELKALMLANKQYLANPTNWARQSALAADGKMAELEALKGQLKRGL
jgi:predicted flap endonuclease-1-like 5' DNA nuclease